MATVSVDLPAHNIAQEVGGVVTPVADPECLADPSATAGITVSSPGDVFVVGNGGTSLGFGLFALPPGGRLVDVRFVAHAQRLDASFDVPPDSWDSVVIAPVPTVGPSLAVNYDDRRGLEVGHTLGYALTPTGVLAEIVGDPIQHGFEFSDPLTEPTYDVVIAGIGSPPEGANGLCPEIVIADSNWWETPPAADHPILLTYLALRVTYATGGAPPCQLYPRDDARGAGGAAIWPPPSSDRPGSYY